MADAPERWGIAANVIDDNVLRRGAKVFVRIIPGDPSSALVRGRSIGGRPIEKWIATKRLTDWRPALLMEREIRDGFCSYASKEDARNEIVSRGLVLKGPQ